LRRIGEGLPTLSTSTPRTANFQAVDRQAAGEAAVVGHSDAAVPLEAGGPTEPPPAAGGQPPSDGIPRAETHSPESFAGVDEAPASASPRLDGRVLVAGHRPGFHQPCSHRPARRRRHAFPCAARQAAHCAPSVSRGNKWRAASPRAAPIRAPPMTSEAWWMRTCSRLAATITASR
jgi:hypothetical protein